MKPPLLACVIITTIAGSLMTGCQTPRATRIDEHAALFASLDPATQAVIKAGLFDYGYSSDMVYMALGKPSRRTSAETVDGTVETWVFRNFVYGNIAGTMKMSANTPGSKPYGPIVSSSAPGGPSLFSTKAGPVQPTISDGSDAPVATLYLDLLNGRVVAARIDP